MNTYSETIPVPDHPAIEDAAELCEAYFDTPEGQARISTMQGHLDFQHALVTGLWGIAATSRTTIDITEEFERTTQ